MIYKTPILALAWVNITNPGKLKMNKDPKSTNPDDYFYTASVIFENEESMLKQKAIFDKFWRENKSEKLTKQRYNMFKPEMVKVLDANGKEQKDEDGEIIREHSGRYILQAKTGTTWPDGTPNKVKVLRANGRELPNFSKLIGEGSIGVIHGKLAINEYPGNEGLLFYLQAIQMKKFVEYIPGEIDAEDLGGDDGMDDGMGDEPNVEDISKDKTTEPAKQKVEI